MDVCRYVSSGDIDDTASMRDDWHGRSAGRGRIFALQTFTSPVNHHR